MGHSVCGFQTVRYFVDGAVNHYTLYDVKVMSCSVL